MRQISITSTMSLDGSELAEDLVRHGLALCDREHVDLVDVSVVTTAGTTERMQFSISDNAEPIAAMSVDLSAEIIDSSTVRVPEPARKTLLVRPFTLDDLNGESWSEFLRHDEMEMGVFDL